ASTGATSQSRSLDGEIVRLCSTGGEDDLGWRHPETGGHPLPGLLEGVLGATRHLVDTRGIAEALGGERRHGLPDARAHRCGGGVVEIDHCHSPLSQDGPAVPWPGCPPSSCHAASSARRRWSGTTSPTSKATPNGWVTPSESPSSGHPAGVSARQ